LWGGLLAAGGLDTKRRVARSSARAKSRPGPAAAGVAVEFRGKDGLLKFSARKALGGVLQ
jgi:hypothetical protein